MISHMSAFIYLYILTSICRRKSDQEIHSSEHFKGIVGCILGVRHRAMTVIVQIHLANSVCSLQIILDGVFVLYPFLEIPTPKFNIHNNVHIH